MTKNVLAKALSISGPVFDMVGRDGLTGRVLANYPSAAPQRGSGHRRWACNLVTSEGEIIALVSPAIGNGPLNIVIEATRVLDRVKAGKPVGFSKGRLVLGDWLVVSLDGAQLWRPEVNWECLTKQWRALDDSLAVLCDWLSQHGAGKGLLGLVLDGEKGNIANEAGTDSLQNLVFLARARVAITGLLHALRHGDRLGIRESASLLAGLGPGLTPAGDDYLMGLMGGIQAWPSRPEISGLSPGEICQIIFDAAQGRTTILSRAFLCSAKDGLFGENWHQLLAALVRGETTGIRWAASRVLSSGATSGADALAGFLSPYLSTIQA